MLYLPLVFGLCVYAGIFLGSQRLLRKIRGKCNFIAVWSLIFITALDWLIVIAVTSGKSCLQLLWAVATQPNEDIWAIKFWGILFFFLFASPAPVAAACIATPPTGRWWASRLLQLILALDFGVLTVLHFTCGRVCRLTVHDQFHNPVPNVRVTYLLDGRSERSTDASGALNIPFYAPFHRLDICDAVAGGFIVDYRLSSHRAYDPIPKEVVIPAWKVLRAPQLLLSRPHISVVTDGSSHYINLVREKASRDPLALTDIELRVQAPQVAFDRNHPMKQQDQFAWSIDVLVRDGGLQLAKGGYKYLAPETGYTNRISKTFDPSDATWNSSFAETFYLKLRDGKVFAVAEITITSLLDNPMIFVDATINPAADRNLFCGYGNLLSHSETETQTWLSHLFSNDY